MNEDTIGVIGSILLGIIFIVGYFAVDAYSCASTAGVMQVPYQYKIITGCMIKPNPGKWIPLKNYREIKSET
jgi:hypothetical protein